MSAALACSGRRGRFSRGGNGFNGHWTFGLWALDVDVGLWTFKPFELWTPNFWTFGLWTLDVLLLDFGFWDFVGRGPWPVPEDGCGRCLKTQSVSLGRECGAELGVFPCHNK
jgi:hypothetical protein